MRVIRTGLFRFYPPVSSKLAKYFRCGIAFARHPQFGRFVVELIDYEPILFWIRTVMEYARSSQHAFFVALQIAPPQALWLRPPKALAYTLSPLSPQKSCPTDSPLCATRSERIGLRMTSVSCSESSPSSTWIIPETTHGPVGT